MTKIKKRKNVFLHLWAQRRRRSATGKVTAGRRYESRKHVTATVRLPTARARCGIVAATATEPARCTLRTINERIIIIIIIIRPHRNASCDLTLSPAFRSVCARVSACVARIGDPAKTAEPIEMQL